MSQHDLDIANQGFAAFRADLNNALKALGSLSSGTAEPATTYANQLWYETDTNTLHIRDEANSAWLDLMVIDQTTGSPSFMAGNVGIGTNAPTHNLDIVGVGDTALHITATSSGAGNDDDAFLVLDAAETGEAVLSFRQDGVEKALIEFFSGGGPDVNFTTVAGTGANFDFQPEGALAMRITSAGNVGIGTSSPAVKFHVISDLPTAHSNTVSIFDRTTSDGEIIRLRKSGTTVGSIGSAAGTYLFVGSTNTADAYIRFYGDSSNPAVRPATSTGANSDNAIDLGHTTARWDDIYAGNATIQTSDRNEKQDIEELNDAERRVAVACKGLMRKFRWISSVAEKGDDARIHFGIIAQDLQAAFAAEGLDAGRYAMFIHSTWTDEETGEERSRMGVRYTELLAFMIAAL